MPWEVGRFGEDGTRLRLAYDRPTRHQKLAIISRCVELQLSRDASDRLLVDGTLGELATAKQSRYFNDERLRETERTWDMVFEPREFLEPREVGP